MGGGPEDWRGSERWEPKPRKSGGPKGEGPEGCPEGGGPKSGSRRGFTRQPESPNVHI